MKRKTIGLFIDQLVYEYHSEFWHGVCEQADLLDINLVTYVGSTLITDDLHYISMNKVYSLISEKRIDGSIILISSLASLVNQKEKNNFVKNISSICPTVVVGDIMPDYHSISVDNHIGIFDAVNHLIKKHNRKNIAFIGGPLSSSEATIRFDAYKDALKQNQIPYDEDLFYEGRFDFESGQEAVQNFIEKNKTFDAIAVASDWMAFGALQELKKNKITVPDQVAITGFDNVETAYVSNPPLSSVKQPVFEMGEKSVELIINILDSKECDKEIIFPTEFLSRDSCGCLISEEKNVYDETGDIVNSNNPEQNRFVEIKTELMEKLNSDISFKKNDFLLSFNSSLENAKTSDDISEYYSLIGDIRDEMINFNVMEKQIPKSLQKSMQKKSIKTKEINSIIGHFCRFNRGMEDILHKASLLIARKAEQIQFIKHLDSNNKNSEIIRIGQDLLTNYSKKDLFENITNNFPVIDISSCSLVTYDNQNIDLNAYPSKIIFHFDNHKQSNPDNTSFDSTLILPDDFWPKDDAKPWKLVIAPMVTDDKPVGYVVYKSSSLFGQIFETFSSEIASALRGVNIYEERQKVAALIEKRSAKITELIKPMMVSIQEISGISNKEIKTIKTLSGMTTSGLDDLKESSDIIGKATLSINDLLQLVDVIEDISSNINILALNASIESARAGKYGLGFQVIAEEIKELSDNTATNTKNIADALKKVVQNIEKSNEASKENYNVFQNVNGQVNEVTEFLTGVIEKMNGLSNTSVEILREIR